MSDLNYAVQISRERMRLRVLAVGGCMKIVLTIVSSTRMEKSVRLCTICLNILCFIKL